MRPNHPASRPAGRPEETGQSPHPSPFLRHASAGGGRGRPRGAGASRPRQCRHHPDLHAGHGTAPPRGVLLLASEGATQPGERQVSALDAATIQSLRASLEEHREGLRKEIADQGADPDSDELGADLDRGFADSAHSTAERARLIALVTELRNNLKDVEVALSKTDRGTYGVCERCGRPIGAERLEAIPW